MTIASLLAAAADIQVDPNNGLGQAVTYTPPAGGGDPVPVNGIFEEYQQANERNDAAGKTTERHAVIEVPRVVDGSPQTYLVGGTFTVDSEIWQINGHASKGTHSQTVSLYIPGHQHGRKVKSLS